MSELEMQPEENKQDISLPQDYDAYFGFDGANNEIRTLLEQAMVAQHEAHNAEIAELQEVNRKRAEADAEEIEELRELVAASDNLERTIKALREELHDAREEREAALQKRDNAVRIAEEAEEAQAKAEADAERLRSENESLRQQVNELEGMLRTYRVSSKPPSLGGLQLTSTLPTLSEEEVKERKERERLETINRNLMRRGLDPLQLPPLPSTESTPESAEDEVTDEDIAEQMGRVSEAAAADEETFQVVHVDTGADEVAAGAAETVGDAESEDRSSSPVEKWMIEIDQRVSELESWRKRANYYLDYGHWPTEDGY